MTFSIDVHHYVHMDTGATEALTAIAAQLVRIEGKVNQTMSFAEDVRTQLGQINALTSEIASDQADLIARLQANPTDAERQEILDALSAHTATLESVAAGYTPVPPTPGETPGETPVEPAPGDGGGEPAPTDGGVGGDGGSTEPTP